MWSGGCVAEAELGTVSTAFPNYGAAADPWACARALSGSGRRSPGLADVFRDGAVLDAPDAPSALARVRDGLSAHGVSTLSFDGSAESARAVVDVGGAVVVPFRVATGARPVLVSGYRLVSDPRGGCAEAIQDMLVVDTIEVIAYGMPLADYHRRLAAPAALAVAIDTADVDRLSAALARHATP